MKTIRLLAIASLFPLTWLHAQAPMSPRSGATTFDNVAEFAYAGRAEIGEGSLRLGKIDSSQARVIAVTAMPFGNHNEFLAGFGVQWLEFHPPAGSLVPERLGSVSFKVGFNHQFDSPWSVRAEIDPGVYNDLGGGSRGFGVPAALRLVYAVNRDLQWVLGANIDTRSGHPVVGGVGVRWKFAPDWTLALLLPAPRIEWAVTETVALFAGASLRGGTFRVAENFGRTRGRPAFDGQIVDYREITVGAGARWQLTPATALNFGLGQMLDRRFEFHDRNLLLNGDGAPAAQLTLTSAF